MNIDPKADFAGQPMMLVRDLVRKIHHRYDGVFNADDWAYVFAGGTPGDRERVLAELIACGYMRPVAPGDDDQLPLLARFREGPMWVFTELGNQLANASAARPLRRASAEKALAGFLDRVDEVEAHPLCLHVVTEAILFGSMLDPDRQTVSDVDVGSLAVGHARTAGCDQAADARRRRGSRSQASSKLVDQTSGLSTLVARGS